MHFLVAIAPKIHVQLEFLLVSKIDLASASRAVWVVGLIVPSPYADITILAMLEMLLQWAKKRRLIKLNKSKVKIWEIVSHVRFWGNPAQPICRRRIWIVPRSKNYPSSRIRTSDLWMSDVYRPTTVHRSTNWAIEGSVLREAWELDLYWLWQRLRHASRVTPSPSPFDIYLRVRGTQRRSVRNNTRHRARTWLRDCKLWWKEEKLII